MSGGGALRCGGRMAARVAAPGPCRHVCQSGMLGRAQPQGVWATHELSGGIDLTLAHDMRSHPAPRISTCPGNGAASSMRRAHVTFDSIDA
jgi:hypothetical protein